MASGCCSATSFLSRLATRDSGLGTRDSEGRGVPEGVREAGERLGELLGLRLVPRQRARGHGRGGQEAEALGPGEGGKIEKSGGRQEGDVGGEGTGRVSWGHGEKHDSLCFVAA